MPPQPQNTLAALGQTLFSDANVSKVMKIMDNPMRGFVKLFLDETESFGTALIAGSGSPQDLMFALMQAFIERAEDPIIAMRILLNMSVKGTELPFVKRGNW